MAEGVWQKTEDGDEVEFEFFVNGKDVGLVVRCPDAGNCLAVVYPGKGIPPKTVADNVTEADAKKAVEEYWVDKEPSA